jgi:hypothetical protein
MLYASVPAGITPPAPGLEKEEPTFWIEDDIPSDDGHAEGVEDKPGRPDSAPREERTRHKPERE